MFKINKQEDTIQQKILSQYTEKFETEQRELPKKITQEFKLKKFELELGDMIFLNFDTIHRSGINCSKIFRMSTICRYHKMALNDFNPGLNIYRYSDKKLNKEVHGFLSPLCLPISPREHCPFLVSFLYYFGQFSTLKLICYSVFY